jgi:uncharacterized membrane protein YkvA (DUF1232 family)
MRREEFLIEQGDIKAAMPESLTVSQSKVDFRGCLKSILFQIRLLKGLAAHPDTPIGAKAVAVCALAYVFSPIQLIPTFLPVIGQLDDLMVLYLGLKLTIRLTPRSILIECGGGSYRPPIVTEEIYATD